ncbi:MAG: hypothetical protein JNJ89_02620 [Rubrivivax sp.]|nr:hypothetical protein [Rubrivivax sp.]
MLLTLIDEVLDFSKIEAQRMQIEQQPFAACASASSRRSRSNTPVRDLGQRSFGGLTVGGSWQGQLQWRARAGRSGA